MSIALKILILCCGLFFVGIVLYLLVQRRINERHSLLWLFGAVIILLLSILPNSLDIVAGFFHVDYPPALLFLFAILILLIITLYQSIQISILQERLREITQHFTVFEESYAKKPEDKEGSHGD